MLKASPNVDAFDIMKTYTALGSAAIERAKAGLQPL